MEQIDVYSHRRMSDVPPKRSRLSGRPADGERSSAPQPALDALLAGASGDPVRRALWLDALDRRLHPLLPPALAAHARLANIDGTTMVFIVDSPAWHARLRLASAGLIDAARSIGLDVASIVVRTTSRPLRPAPPTATTGTRRAAGMSATASESLRAALASLDASVGGEAGQEGPVRDGPAAGPGPSRTGHPNGAKGQGS